jgi:hypothetical protein
VRPFKWGLSGGNGFGVGGIGGNNAVLRRLHFPSKSEQPNKGGIGFLWAATRRITFQISDWLTDDNRLSQYMLCAFRTARDHAVSKLLQRSNSSSEIFLRSLDFD